MVYPGQEPLSFGAHFHGFAYSDRHEVRWPIVVLWWRLLLITRFTANNFEPCLPAVMAVIVTQDLVGLEAKLKVPAATVLGGLEREVCLGHEMQTRCPPSMAMPPLVW